MSIAIAYSKKEISSWPAAVLYFVLSQKKTLEELSIRGLDYSKYAHELLKKILSSEKLKSIELDIERIVDKYYNFDAIIVDAIHNEKNTWKQLAIHAPYSFDERFIEKIIQTNRGEN